MKNKYIKDYFATPEGKLEYRGKYYVSRISDEERKKEGMTQLIYCIVCALLLVLALCIPCEGNQTIYIVIPLELTFLCLWSYITGALAFLKSKERLEEKEYDKAYQGPIQALTIAIFLYVFSIGGQFIGIVMNAEAKNTGDIYFAMILVFVLVMSIVVWNRQRKVMHLVSEEKGLMK